MNCYNCENKRRIYTLGCLGCAVRLVKSARPSKLQQEGMIAHIEKYGKFTREDIVKAIKDDA